MRVHQQWLDLNDQSKTIIVSITKAGYCYADLADGTTKRTTSIREMELYAQEHHLKTLFLDPGCAYGGHMQLQLPMRGNSALGEPIMDIFLFSMDIQAQQRTVCNWHSSKLGIRIYPDRSFVWFRYVDNEVKTYGDAYPGYRDTPTISMEESDIDKTKRIKQNKQAPILKGLDITKNEIIEYKNDSALIYDTYSNQTIAGFQRMWANDSPEIKTLRRSSMGTTEITTPDHLRHVMRASIKNITDTKVNKSLEDLKDTICRLSKKLKPQRFRWTSSVTNEDCEYERPVCYRMSDDLLAFVPSERYIFWYNIKTKKKYETRKLWGGDEYETMIPQPQTVDGMWYNYSYGACRQTQVGHWPNIRYEKEYAPKFYLTQLMICKDKDGNVITPIECFEGSVFADLIKSCENTSLKNMLALTGYRQYRGSNDTEYDTFKQFYDAPIKDYFDSGSLPGFFARLLCNNTKTHLFLEQACKMGMLGIAAAISGCDNLFPTQKQYDKLYGWNGKDKVIAIIDPKETSLLKNLGINAKKAKILDQMLFEDRIKDEGYRSFNNRRYYLRQLLQTWPNQLNQLDDETFKTLLLNGDWLKSEALQEVFKYKQPKQLSHFIEKYKDTNPGHLEDYARMRDQLRVLQEKHPDKQIYSDAKYPLIPEKSKKYVRLYDDDPATTSYWYRKTALQKYNSYIEKYKNTIAVKDDEDRIIGVVLDMTPGETINYLHDDLSFWVAFYKDEAKQAGFEVGIQRVLPLEYEDKETGLCVVAPKHVNDLNKEGSVLHHCVASFVDPIINNKENVMFIRRMDMKDVPYYTVALNNQGKIEQIHCYQNGDLTSADQERAYANSSIPSYDKVFDVIKFLNNWSKKMGKTKVDPTTIMEHYRALCANR